jgi:hypothetical protein
LLDEVGLGFTKKVNASNGVSTLIWEYVWANGQVVGVFEGGQLYFVR